MPQDAYELPLEALRRRGKDSLLMFEASTI